MDDSFVERRMDHKRRNRIHRMTKAQLIRELYTDHLTGLPNSRAYDDSDKREIQVMVDVDSLKWVNDNLGYDAGDALLRTIAQVFESCQTEIYRIGGDEFIAQFDDPTEVIFKLGAAQKILQTAIFSFVDKTGQQRAFRGIEISYGSGSNGRRAELRLAKQKAIREMIGSRSRRGERPYRLTEVDYSQATVSPGLSRLVATSTLSRPTRGTVATSVREVL